MILFFNDPAKMVRLSSRVSQALTLFMGRALTEPVTGTLYVVILVRTIAANRNARYPVVMQDFIRSNLFEPPMMAGAYVTET
jgi:hypothetical protein